MQLLKFDTPDSQGEPPARTECENCRYLGGAQAFIRADLDLEDATLTKIEFTLELRGPEEDQGVRLTPDHNFTPAGLPPCAISLRDIFDPEDKAQNPRDTLTWGVEKAIASIAKLRTFVRSEAVVFKLSVGDSMEFTWMHPIAELRDYIERA